MTYDEQTFANSLAAAMERPNIDERNAMLVGMITGVVPIVIGDLGTAYDAEARRFLGLIAKALDLIGKQMLVEAQEVAASMTAEELETHAQKILEVFGPIFDEVDR